MLGTRSNSSQRRSNSQKRFSIRRSAPQLPEELLSSSSKPSLKYRWSFSVSLGSPRRESSSPFSHHRSSLSMSPPRPSTYPPKHSAKMSKSMIRGPRRSYGSPRRHSSRPQQPNSCPSSPNMITSRSISTSPSLSTPPAPDNPFLPVSPTHRQTYRQLHHTPRSAPSTPQPSEFSRPRRLFPTSSGKFS